MTDAEQARAAVDLVVATRPEAVATMLADLDRVIADEEALQDHLEQVAEVAVRTVDGCSAAGVTLYASGRWVTAASTDTLTLQIDRDQYVAGEGPCLDAAQNSVVNVVDVAEAAARWPAFTAAATAHGIRSFLAAPLFSSERPMGSLNLYSHDTDGFDEIDGAYVNLLASYAADAVEGFRRTRDAQRLADQLEEAMASRAVIEQAKGIVMALHGVDEQAAFDLLKGDSQRRNIKLRSVARELVDRARTSHAPLADEDPAG